MKFGQDDIVLATSFPFLNLSPRAFVHVIVNLQHGWYGLFGYILPPLASHGIVQLLFGWVDPMFGIVVVVVVAFHG